MKKNILIFLITILSFTSLTKAQTNVSGALSSDTTWSLADSPIILTGNVLVPNGVTLTIEAGVTVKVNSGLYIKNEGVIKAVGTSSDKITFQSSADSPAKSDWEGIRIRSTGGSSIDVSQNYSSGSQFKYVTIKHADIGLYVYDTGLHTSYTTFENNNKGFEIRKTDGVVIDNSTFTDNTTGIWSEYETFSPDDITGNISNTYIRNSTFSNNGNAIDLIINQRYFENLKIYNNVVKENTIGIDFSGGGYGCRVLSVDIYKNILVDNTQYGLRVGQIYGYGSFSGSEPAGESPLKFYDNKVINNSIYWDYGGGISGVTTKIYNNIIYNPRSDDNSYSHGIYFNGGTSKNDTITNNLIVSNSKALSFRDSYSDLSNKHISRNTIIGTPLGDNSLIESFGSGHKFIYNNFTNVESNYTLKNDDSNAITAENNYWGTSTESEIQEAIYDFSDDFELGAVDYTPFLTSPNIDAPISPPSYVTKSVTGNDVVLNWSANGESDTAGYKLYYGDPTGYSYSTVIDLGNVTTYTVTGGDIATEYAITAYDTSLDGTDDMVDGNESWYSKANSLPDLPTNIVLEGAPRKSKLSWTLSASDNIAYYEIYRGLSAQPTTLHYTTNSETENNYVDQNLTVGETYFYRIKVVDINGISSNFSDDFSVTIPTSWIVSKETGSENGFGSVENPFINIQDAVDVSINEDIVLVSPGTYIENVLMFEKMISVTTTDPANSASTTIIDGGSNGLPVFKIDGNGSNFGGLSANIEISGFTLKNGLSPTNEVPGGLLIKSIFSSDINISISHLIIENNQAINASGGSYFYYANNIEVSDVIYRNNIGNGSSAMGAFNAQFSLNRGIFYNNASNGYTFDFWHNSNSPQFSTITNSLVRNNNDSGAFNSMDGIIMNTTIIDNGSQMRFRGSSSIVNSIVTTGQFISSSSGLLKIYNSHIEDGQNSIDIFPSFLTYENNLEGDIYFTDAENLDFTLSEYSPCVGAGLNSITLYGITYDLSSNTDLNLSDRPLPQGTNIDIGAYENNLGITAHNSNIYVSINDGSNEGSVGLETQPFKTIQAAINYAIDGDTIYVLPGTYPGGASIINKGLNFISTTPLGAIINNNVNNSNTFTFSSNTGTYYSTITGFDINKTANGGADGIRASNNHYVNLYKSKISNFSSATGTGVSAIQAENCLFINNVRLIYNDQCSTGSANITPLLKNCTIINSINMHTACETISLDIINSIVLISDTSQNAYSSPPNFNKVITNDVNVVPQENSTWNIALDGEKDIYFTDFTNGDYTLQDFSPAIGYGFFPVSEDITGGARPMPVGSSLDIGAYENTLGSPLNGSPRFDAIADVSIDEDSSIQSLNILNVVDGDILETQNLSFSVTTDNDTLFDLIEINYTQGSETAVLNYTPAQDKNGIANIAVTLNDNAGTDGGGIDSIKKTFTITINPLNDQPIASDHDMVVDEGATTDVLDNNQTNLLHNAVDADQDELSAMLVTEPSNGSLTLNLDGTFIYTHDGSETTSDSFTYKANDGLLDSNIATVTITINPVNDAPVVSNHALTVDEGGVATSLDNSEVSLLFNASDAEGDTLTAIIETEPNNGILVLNTDGTFNYTHDGSDTLTDSFTYKADDSDLTSEIGTVSITINPVNDNFPSDINLSYNLINENQDADNGFLIGQFTAIDLDLPSDSHTFELVDGEGDTNNDSFIIEGNNLKTFTSFDFEIQESLSIRVKTIDEVNQTFEKVFTINIINVNDISIESVVTNSYCEGDTSNGSITISEISNTSGDLTFSWSASNGGSIPIGQENNQNLTDLDIGTYTVIISDATDFTLTEEFQITLIPQYSELSVCYVTSDEEDPSKNRIFINNQGNYNISSYEVLRETNTANVYNVIGNIDSNLNSFLDNNSDNNTQEYRYKVRLVDLCGNISEDSDLHKTVLLQSSISVKNNVNLNWTGYKGVDVPSYNVYRKINNGNYELLAEISSNSSSYNDQTADTSTNSYEYYIAVQVNNCNTTTAKSSSKNNLTEIKSNRQQIGDASLSLNELMFENSVSIFPNPATDTINININSDISYIKSEVYNLLGQRLLETDKKSVSIENLSKSTYFLKIFTEKGIVLKKFIKN